MIGLGLHEFELHAACENEILSSLSAIAMKRNNREIRPVRKVGKFYMY